MEESKTEPAQQEEVIKFEPVGGQTEAGQMEELWIFKERSGKGWKMTVPCVSVRVDNEFRINGFINTEAEENERFRVSFMDQRLVIVWQGDENESPESAEKKALELIRKTKQEFDLMPVCMKCGRTGSLKLQERGDPSIAVCGVCQDEQALIERKKKVMEKHQVPLQKEYFLGLIPKHAVGASALIGLRSALIGTAAGTLLLILEVFLHIPLPIPVLSLHDLIGIATAAAGFFAVMKLMRMGHMSAGTRFLIVTAVSLALMAVLSLLTYWLLFALYYQLFGERMGLNMWIDVPLYTLNLGLGLPGYFLGAVLGYFLS